jgi:hypothetical protein
MNHSMAVSASAGFHLAGKTSLFQRVAMSPGGTFQGDKKANLNANSLQISKGNNNSINDADTSASTIVNN